MFGGKEKATGRHPETYTYIHTPVLPERRGRMSDLVVDQPTPEKHTLTPDIAVPGPALRALARDHRLLHVLLDCPQALRLPPPPPPLAQAGMYAPATYKVDRFTQLS